MIKCLSLNICYVFCVHLWIVYSDASCMSQLIWLVCLHCIFVNITPALTPPPRTKPFLVIVHYFLNISIKFMFQQRNTITWKRKELLQHCCINASKGRAVFRHARTHKDACIYTNQNWGCIVQVNKSWIRLGNSRCVKWFSLCPTNASLSTAIAQSFLR